MKIKKLLALSLAAVLLTACTEIKSEPPTETALNSVTDSTEETATTTQQPVFQVELPDIKVENTQLYSEAEKSRLYGHLKIATARKGYSGSGYVTGFDKDPDNQVILSCYVPTTQHYDIAICVAADKTVKNRLIVNSVAAGEFTLEGTGEFIRVVFHSIFLEAGHVAVSIGEIDGGLDLDYLELTNSTQLASIEYNSASAPVNIHASIGAKRLMKVLSEQYGKGMLTGQFASSAENKELELIHQITGQYPAIRCGDLGADFVEDPENATEIEAAKAWAGAGGIVSFMWYWPDPISHKSVYAENTEFSLAKAVTEKDISKCTPEEMEQMLADGKISEECAAIIRDIDALSNQLQPLNEADIPVLWRPLHEAGGGWYWWGSDGAAPYKWLWRLLYQRMVGYHKLNNLIWVWNGQSADYYVGENFCDIASIDAYLTAGEPYGSRSGQFQWLYSITGGKKMLALSECSSIPDVDAIHRDKAVWAFFGLWYGNYLMNNDGSFSSKYTSEEDLNKYYNSEGSITLSEYAEIAKKSLANE